MTKQPSEFTKQFSSNLNKLVAESGLSKAEICRALDIKPNRFSYYLKNGEPPLEIVYKLSKILNVSLGQLIAGAKGLRDIYSREHLVEVRNSFERGYVERLLKILRSKDELIRGAIMPNLIAFSERLREEKEKKEEVPLEKKKKGGMAG